MKVLEVGLENKSYNVYIKRDLLNNIGIEIRKIYSGNTLAVITDANVNILHGEKLIRSLESEGYDVVRIVLEAGERSKSISVLEKVYKTLAESGIKRNSLILTFGGGVVGDAGGFAASTFLRGVPYVQIPTTLLAQVDSSVGGKVAINLDEGKNLVGSFYHPEAVFIDPDLLLTLNERTFNDGMAEVIKYGAIKDKSLFYKILDNDRNALCSQMEDIIYCCCKTKRDVVQIDEKDTGERMLLNFGHTIGHAIEKYYNYNKFTHGEAVAIGMYTITKIAEEKGMTAAGASDLIKASLTKYKLPCSLSDMDYDKILKSMMHDKKNLNGVMHLILLKAIGESYIYKIDAGSMPEFIIKRR